MRRRVGEAYAKDCVVPTVKFGGGSVMIWGCMASAGTGELFICEGRMNSEKYTRMLDTVLNPSFSKIYPGESREQIWFQQDNAPCHTSSVSRDFLRRTEINVLDWPAQSPDLNPIEHLWSVLKTNVAKHKTTSKAQLIEQIKKEWQNIDSTICKNLVDSMPKRVKAVIKAKGFCTKY